MATVQSSSSELSRKSDFWDWATLKSKPHKKDVQKAIAWEQRPVEPPMVWTYPYSDVQKSILREQGPSSSSMISTYPYTYTEPSTTYSTVPAWYKNNYSDSDDDSLKNSFESDEETWRCPMDDIPAVGLYGYSYFKTDERGRPLPQKVNVRRHIGPFGDDEPWKPLWSVEYVHPSEVPRRKYFPVTLCEYFHQNKKGT